MYELLKAKIKDRNISYTQLAELLGITRQCLYKKANGQTEFTGSEIKRISAILELSNEERDAIFLS